MSQRAWLWRCQDTLLQHHKCVDEARPAVPIPYLLSRACEPTPIDGIKHTHSCCFLQSLNEQATVRSGAARSSVEQERGVK